MTAPHVQRLRRLHTRSVTDALDKLQLPGAVTGLAQRSGPGRRAGRAVTNVYGWR